MEMCLVSVGSAVLCSSEVTLASSTKSPLAAICLTALAAATSLAAPPEEAPTVSARFYSNGFTTRAAFAEDLKEFSGVETPADGVGPVYNSISCAVCHQTPVIGGASQIVEVRAGTSVRDKDGKLLEFREHPGGSVIHQSALDPAIQQHLTAEDDTRTFRLSTNLLGAGYIEAISDDAIRDYATAQSQMGHPEIQGKLAGVKVSISLTESVIHVGRFGWKCQKASLLDFSADAYVQEMGITSPLQIKESSSDGRSVEAWDLVRPEPDEEAEPAIPYGKGVEAFTRFMRSTPAPARQTLSTVEQGEADAGKTLFTQIGCAVCHRPEWTTASAGTAADAFLPERKVPAALGDKTIRPYSDFLLHDIGTGDGIVQFDHSPVAPRSSESKRAVTLNQLQEKAQLGAKSASSLTILFEDPRRVENLSEALIQRILPEAEKSNVEWDDEHQRFIFKGDALEMANRLRTAPLWGLGGRLHLMHDGQSLTPRDAIAKHEGEAAKVKAAFLALSDAEKAQLLKFLSSL